MNRQESTSRHREKDFSSEYFIDYGFYDPTIASTVDGSYDLQRDKAVYRALNSDYQVPNAEKLTSDPERTLFVGRLNYSTDEKKLEEYFGRYGKLRSVRVVRDFVTGHSKGYGFVEFKSRSDAKHAYDSSYKICIDRRDVIVEFELERRLDGWRPRRLGGGLGGYKESGQLRFGGRYKPFLKYRKR